MSEISNMKKLIEELNTYRYEYYNKNNSIISDEKYDSMFDMLKTIENRTGVIFPNSPTQTVGFEVVSKLQKVSHKIPLLSMDKTKNIDDLVGFVNNKDFIMMFKADGLTTELIYEDGILIQASTRGNGEIGEDVTHNVKTIQNVPHKINHKGILIVIGESVILKKDFEKINENLNDGVEKYKTQRNLASGSIRQLDSKLCSERNLKFFVFKIIGLSNETKSENLKWALENGFDIVRTYAISTNNKSNINEFFEGKINRMRETAEELGFPIDGIIVQYDNIAYSESLGSTSHHPLDSIAFKFKDETESTILRGIEWSVGRTGVITPVAMFDTVNIDGTDVSRASVHNLSIMWDLKLGVGDEIEVYKANMIIPQILRNNTRSNSIEIPDECPICKAETTAVTQNKSTVLMCTNKHCPSQLLGRFTHFASRDAMNIDGLSESTIEKFIQMGFLRKFSNIYELDRYKEIIINMDGFGKRSYENLINAINKSKNVKLNNYLYAMGINNIGKSSAKTIAEYFNYDARLFFVALSEDFDFTKLKDFGQVANDSLYDWYNNHYENTLRMNLVLILNFVKDEKKVRDGIFNGMKIYATGTFANYKKEEIKSVIESLGAEFANGYSKSLDYLVVGSIKGSSKEDKAKSDGVKILSENEFINMIKNT